MNPGRGAPMSDTDGTGFVKLLTRLARVQKAEIDEQARKTHKAYAKPGQIAVQPEE